MIAFSMGSTPGNELATSVVTLHKGKSHLPDPLVWLMPSSITTLLSSAQQRTTAKFSLNTTHTHGLRKSPNKAVGFFPRCGKMKELQKLKLLRISLQ